MDNWLRSNIVIRVVAVLVGVLLWVIVRLDVQNTNTPPLPTTVSQDYTDVSIQIKGLDENRFTLRAIEPERVSLRVVGTSSALARVSITNYKIELDLSSARAGEQRLPLQGVGFPDNVEVVLNPPVVSVTLDEKERKEVPVTIEVVGKPAEGFTAGEPVVQPNRVNVTVTSSLADQVARVVGVLNIEGATESVTQQVRLTAQDPDGNELDVQIAPAVVEVEMPITSPFKTVPLQISLQGSTPSGLAVGAFEQNASEVTVFAPQSLLNSLEFYDGLRIDLSTLSQSRTFEFQVPLRDGVERVEPMTVVARVTIVPAVAATLEHVPLALNGRNADYNYTITVPAANAVNVSVEAAPEIIANLDSDDVQAIVDVSNMAPGEYQVPIDYALPSFVELTQDNTMTVTVVIAPKGAAASEPNEPPDETETGTGTGTSDTPALPEQQEDEDVQEADGSGGTDEPASPDGDIDDGADESGGEADGEETAPAG